MIHSQSQFHSLNPKSLLTTACSQRYTWRGGIHTNGQRRERERQVGSSVCDVVSHCNGIDFTSPGQYHMAQTLCYLPAISAKHTHTHTHLLARRASVTDIPLIHSWTPLQTAILCFPSWLQLHLLWLKYLSCADLSVALTVSWSEVRWLQQELMAFRPLLYSSLYEMEKAAINL